jgi:hypothetical protein
MRLVLAAAGNRDQRIGIEVDLLLAAAAGDLPDPESGQDLRLLAVLGTAGPIEFAPKALQSVEPAPASLLELLGIDAVKSGGEAGDRPRVEILGVDVDPATDSLHRNRAAAAEGIGDPQLPLTSRIEDLADQ